MFTIATFNVENLMRRFDFSGFRNELYQDRTLKLFEIGDEKQYRLLEQARAIAHADDTRQMTALAIAKSRADILCFQEVDNLAALNAFDGRTSSLPVRHAETRAIRRIIEDKFGAGRTADKRWLICGDFNDYRKRLVIDGDEWNGYMFRSKASDHCPVAVTLNIM